MQITMKQTALNDAQPASDRAWPDSRPGSSKPGLRRCRSRLPGWLAILGLFVGFFAPASACFAASSLLSPENRRDLELQPGVVLILVQFKATLGAFSCSPGCSAAVFFTVLTATSSPTDM